MKTFEVHFAIATGTTKRRNPRLKWMRPAFRAASPRRHVNLSKALDRKQRFDMNKNGLEIMAKPIGTATEVPKATSAEAAAN